MRNYYVFNYSVVFWDVKQGLTFFMFFLERVRAERATPAADKGVVCQILPCLPRENSFLFLAAVGGLTLFFSGVFRICFSLAACPSRIRG